MHTELTTQRIDVFGLAVGMFVSKLDMPWSATSFPIEGFMIEQECQAEQLRVMCQHVYIDLKRSVHIPYSRHYNGRPIKLELLPEYNHSGSFTGRPSAKPKKQVKKKTRIQKFRYTTYKAKTSFRQEIVSAQEIYTDASSTLAAIIDDRIDLSSGEIQSLKAISSRMVKSAINNPDALNWVTKINSSYQNLYRQILSTTVTGLIFARQLGLEQRKIEFLTLSLLLRGIGISKLKKSVLIKYHPNKTSFDYQQHLRLTLIELAKFKSLPETVLNTIKNHCENFDGSGYPARRSGNRIPILAQIMRLVVYYEDLVNPLVKSRAISSSQAIALINAQKNAFFESGMIEEFVKAVGIYPTGSFVKLSDASVGMIVEQNPAKRLRSNVAVLVDPNDVKLDDPKVIDLSQDKNAHLSIYQSIPGINLTPEQVLKCSELFQKKPRFFGLFRRVS